MSVADVFILIFVVALLGLIIYFSIIRPRIKHENTCSKCPYSKQCSKSTKSCCDSPKKDEIDSTSKTKPEEKI